MTLFYIPSEERCIVCSLCSVKIFVGVYAFHVLFPPPPGVQAAAYCELGQVES